MSFSQMTTAAFSPGRKNVEELLATARRFGDGSGNKRKQSRADARCAHNWTSPVTSRSEQPAPVTHFAITCETSTASSKKQISPNLLSLSFLASFSTSERSPPTLTVPFPMALISRYADPIAGSSFAGGTSPAPSRYRRRTQD
jgi:hypothetical protein